MRIVLFACALAFTAAPAGVAASPVKATPSARAAIEMATAAWNKAIVANDRPALERMMTEDFVLTSGDMTQWVPRGAWLDNLGKMRIASYQARVTDVRVYGQIAIAEVRGSWDMTMGSERRTTAFHLADTWVLRDGRWQVMRRYMIR